MSKIFLALSSLLIASLLLASVSAMGNYRSLHDAPYDSYGLSQYHSVQRHHQYLAGVYGLPQHHAVQRHYQYSTGAYEGRYQSLPQRHYVRIYAYHPHEIDRQSYVYNQPYHSGMYQSDIHRASGEYDWHKGYYNRAY